MRKIEADILEKLKKKYGINKLKKVAELYGLGIPEKYWFTTPSQKDTEAIDDIIQHSKSTNVAIWTNSVLYGNRIASELLKKLGKIRHSRYIDFMTMANEMVDKFGQMNMSLLNELATEEIIVISNIKPYGDYFLTRVYPLFAAFLDSLANGILEKKIMIVLEITDDDLDGFGKIYGGELAKTINASFEFYQLPTVVSDINEKE